MLLSVGKNGNHSPQENLKMVLKESPTSFLGPRRPVVLQAPTRPPPRLPPRMRGAGGDDGAPRESKAAKGGSRDAGQLVANPVRYPPQSLSPILVSSAKCPPAPAVGSCPHQSCGFVIASPLIPGRRHLDRVPGAEQRSPLLHQRRYRRDVVGATPEPQRVSPPMNVIFSLSPFSFDMRPIP
jgi:hypothetical protein